MIQALLVLATLVCAVQALRSKRLISSALWLAGVSALLATLLYLLAAYQVAVMELSIGAGLVTVLFVFAISVAGEDALDVRSLVPKPLAWVLVIGAATLLIWQLLPFQAEPQRVSSGTTFAEMLWQVRGLDALAQIILI